ncbi:hypothetical protein FACS1894166_13530 [Bacilli bacterium]|nr:hypothetical protein FACS1894166_13530 [Bacilli bacterium]
MKLEIETIANLNTRNRNFGYNISPGGDMALQERKRILQYTLDGYFVKC